MNFDSCTLNSPRPVPRSKYFIEAAMHRSNQNRSCNEFLLSKNYSFANETFESNLTSFEEDTQKSTDLIVASRTMPRKPRKAHQLLKQANITCSPIKHYENTSHFQSVLNSSFKLERPTAPPPPLPCGFESSLIAAMPMKFCSKASIASTASSYLNSGYNSGHSSTPKLPRSDLTFQSTSYSHLSHIQVACGTNVKLGFEHFNTTNSSSFDLIGSSLKSVSPNVMTLIRQPKSNQIWNIMDKIKKSLFKRNLFNFAVISMGFILFLICIGFIVVFQTQVHQFHRKFFDFNSPNHSSSLNNSSNHSLEQIYAEAGSQLVKQTVLFCNGPYFSYQVNNLIVLPFSLFLLIVFSLFNSRESFCISQNKYLSCGGRHRPGLPSAVNPFQRRNRLLIAAIFCIIANEIFKMIEASMFSAAVSDDPPSFNSTTEFLLSSIGHKEYSYGNKDLLRMGLGIEPSLMHEQMDKKKNLLVKLLDRLSNGSTSSPKPAVIFAPSVLRYSKPRLPPRLNANDFQTTTSPQTLNSDLELSLRVVSGINHVKTVKNQTINIIESFNKTLNGSSTKTLFQVSMSLYQNEYVQSALKTVFKYRGFKWNIVLDKLQRLAFMLLEVLIIGMRYYPLLGVLDKNSLVCTLLASLYMWLDTLYNVVMTGMCEGLKLNVSLDLLRDLRRIFGVGFIYDVKEHYTSNVRPAAADHLSPVDTNLLFSTNRIVYTVIKSLPHYFCLSYVTIRFSVTFLKQLYKKLNKKSNQTQENLVYDQALKPVAHKKIELVYTRKYSLPQSKRAYLSFEDRYVNQLFKSKDRVDSDQGWLCRLVNKLGLKNDCFRYSTRIICTYTVCFTVLYYLSCFLVFYGAIFIDLIYFPFVYKCSILVSACLALLVCFVQLVLSMRTFKLHLSSLYKGTSDKYISSKSLFTNKKIATSSFN